MKNARLIAVLLGFLAHALPVGAAERRIALLVAHPQGGDELVPLRYTANDVDRMREVLELFGGFAREDVLVAYGESAGEVEDRFAEARERLQQHRAVSADPSVFVFYYSGHAKDGELRLGESRLPLAAVKDLTDRTQATVRIAFLDACRSGSITRMKGVTKGDPIAMSVEDASEQQGQVFITASSEHEDAQESDDIQGSFFTHFLTTALRGAGDSNRDATVTLGEAYNFAYAGTVARTIGTRGGIQHPSFRFDLQGKGDVVLTRFERPRSAIELPAELGGLFVVFDADRRIVIAELTKEAGHVQRVAVAPGNYVVKKRETDHLRMQRLRVGDRHIIAIDPVTMEKVAFADDYAKGATISAEEVIHGRVGVRLSVGLGTQSFFSSPIREAYIPSLGLAQVAVDFENLLRRGLGVRLDVGFGGSGPRALAMNDPYLGEVSYEVTVSELTAGAGLTSALRLTDWLEATGLVRLGYILLAREFVNGELATQALSTLAPGVGVGLDFRLASWLTAGVGVRVHYMFFNVDDQRSLAYMDGGINLTAVLR